MNAKRKYEKEHPKLTPLTGLTVATRVIEGPWGFPEHVEEPELSPRNLALIVAKINEIVERIKDRT